MYPRVVRVCLVGAALMVLSTCLYGWETHRWVSPGRYDVAIRQVRVVYFWPWLVYNRASINGTPPEWGELPESEGFEPGWTLSPGRLAAWAGAAGICAAALCGVSWTVPGWRGCRPLKRTIGTVSLEAALGLVGGALAAWMEAACPSADTPWGFALITFGAVPTGAAVLSAVLKSRLVLSTLSAAGGFVFGYFWSQLFFTWNRGLNVAEAGVAAAFMGSIVTLALLFGGLGWLARRAWRKLRAGPT